MTVHALTGLFALNALYLLCGAAVLWTARGWSTWLDFARLMGLAYMTGVVVAATLWMLLLIVGIPFSGWLILATPVALAVAAVAAGRRLGRSRPTLGALRGTDALLVTACGVAAAGLFLEGLFRKARLAGLYNWDAWSFWVPKGKVIYLLGELDAGFFTAFPGPSYPPLVPILDAAAFHAMGGLDVNTLHVQYWFFAVGFVWALAGLLAERVPGWILWPFVLLALVVPRLGPRFTIPEADLLLDAFFVLAAVLVFFWILDGGRWRLGLAAVLMCGMVSTKREGILLAALLLGTALAVSIRCRRGLWPPLFIAALAVSAVGAPWRIWYAVHGIEGEGAGGSLDSGRLWDSLRLAFDVLFASDYWSVIVAVTLAALLLGLVGRAYVPVAFFGMLLVLVTVGGGLITWAIPELEITQELGANPIVRYMGAAALLCAAAGPIVLADVWERATKRANVVSS
jgi:hypothetical protein